MNKAIPAVVVAGRLLAGLAAAGPALAVQGDTQLCPPSTNGGTMVNGVCVLPALSGSWWLILGHAARPSSRRARWLVRRRSSGVPVQ
jgi:hypothetical protein